MEFTGERFVPQIHGNIEFEHMHRYLMACDLASGRDVLDIACGEGYGSARLARSARQVYGVDISNEAVVHAGANYVADNIRFLVGSCEAIPLPDQSVDLVVSFETIEHHDKHDEMMLEIKRVLRPNGVVIISSPDKQIYSIEPNYQNPYHVKELFADKFKALLSNHFRNTKHFGQKITYGSAILEEEGSSPQKSYWDENNEIHSKGGSYKPVYILSIASDSELPVVYPGIYDHPESECGYASYLSSVIVERDREIAKLNTIVASSKARQKRSWIKRAFHRWAERGCKEKKTKLLKKLERSLRKRRNKFLGRYINKYSKHITANKGKQPKSPLDRSQSWGDLYVPILADASVIQAPVRAICFYLPQFHPIPENNEWWGDGFTEWTNVRPAKPQFEGHYQPHVPGELGYYNLLDPGVQKRQVELAKLYGIGGFCFYFYWFHGHRLLEDPILRYLADSSLDLPFCLCWANENWSRRWDGCNEDILIAQDHSPQDDMAFIEYISIYLKDPRYIRVGGKPLLLLYRPSLLPNICETVVRWRTWCRENGIGEIYLAYTQSFEKNDPRGFGFDAAVEFPPANASSREVIRDEVPFNEDFIGKTYDIRSLSERSSNYTKPDYKLFRSVCPSWDNTARKKNRGIIFCNGSPSVYSNWLKNAMQETISAFAEPDERLIFINAWNEWAEGAHLEPDAKYGYAFLQATRDALSGVDTTPDLDNHMILVVHDAHPHGAQMIALHIAKVLNLEMSYEVDIVCLGDGPLVDEFSKYGTLHHIANCDTRGDTAMKLARRFAESGKRKALVNTTVSGFFLEILAKEGVTCVALVHELRGVLDQYSLKGQATAIATHATKVIFPADLVLRSFAGFVELSPDKAVILPQGLYKRQPIPDDIQSVRQRLRDQLNIPSRSKIVLGMGFADHRKGIDLFVEAGLLLVATNPETYFIWVGHWDQGIEVKVQSRIAELPHLKHHFIFPGRQEDTSTYYIGADIFAMTSREDPFPSVVLEAMNARLPIVGFKGALGLAHHIENGCGELVEFENVSEYARALEILLESPDKAKAMGRKGAEIIQHDFSFRHYLFNLLEILGCKLKKVSVVIPNYNYALYIEDRIKSVTRQKYPIFEVIFLDDFSTDNSVKIAAETLSREGVDYRIIVNDQNSGSVFRQWAKGIASCTGEYVWIAEADDTSNPAFLGEVIAAFQNPDVVMSYCESQQIDSAGIVLNQNYRMYVSDVDPIRWSASYTRNGVDEITDSLVIKNTIPNVSAVLFKREVISNILTSRIEEICNYKVAGDWFTYVFVLEHGSISFCNKSYNGHRRHTQGVTIGSFGASQLDEIQRVQNFIRDRHCVSVESSAKADAYVNVLKIQFQMI